MDINKAIRMAVDTGNVTFGARGAVKGVFAGKPKMIIVSKNCPADVKAKLEAGTKLSGIPTLIYGGSSIELGSLCGKPFPVSTLLIIEQGNSKILEAVNK